MKIKKFQAKNFREALFLVKQEMGEDAVILSSEEQKGIVPCVEVTAAVDYELNGFGRLNRVTQAYQNAVDSSSETDRPPLPSAEDASDAVPPAKVFAPAADDEDDPSEISEMRKELRSLKDAVEDMRNKGFEVSLPEKKMKVFRYLKKRSVREDLALRLCDRAVNMRELTEIMSKDIRTCRKQGDKKIVVLIGPTGVGKTTTIAKLAARAIAENKRAALINLDTYRIGAIEQIRIYSRIMGIPLDVASDIEELKACILKHEDRDIIFIDTIGRNPKDEKYIEELKDICNLEFPLERHLLVSANSDDEFMLDTCRRYRELPIDYIAFTKVDEAVKFGSVYNISTLYRKPVAYITTGQRVPQDIEFPTSEGLANMILACEVAQ